MSTTPSRDTWRNRALKGVARLVFRYPWPLVIIAVLLTAWSIYLTAVSPGLGYIADTNELIRKDSEVHRNYLNYAEEFSVTPDIVVVIDGANFARNRACADEIAALLKASNQFARVTHRLDLKPLENRFLLFLSTNELAEIEAGVGQLATVLGESNQPLLNVNGMLGQANAMFDESFLRKEENWDVFKPFVSRFVDILTLMANQLEGRSGAESERALSNLLGSEGSFSDLENERVRREYLAFNEGKTLLITITPGPVDQSDISPFADQIATVRAAVAHVQTRYPAIEIGVTGEPVLDADQVESSMASVSAASVLTFILIGALFFFSYHELPRPALAMLVLIMATSCTFGFTVLAVGHLNIITSAFVAMILGLGIDFGIQILGRYEEVLQEGKSSEEAIENAIAYTGDAVLTGAATTAAAFYTMCFNEFIGLNELGLISGSGIFICAAMYLLVFPATVVLWDRRNTHLKESARYRPAMRFRPPWQNQPGTVVGLAVLLTIGALVVAQRVSFDYNLLNLQNPALESVRVARKLFDSSANSIVAGIVLADSLEETRAKAAALAAKSNTVAGVESIADLVPLRQEEKLPRIERIVGLARPLLSGAAVAEEIDAPKVYDNLQLLLTNSVQAEAEAKKYAGIASQAREAQQTFSKLIPALRRAVAAFEKLDAAQVNERLSRYDSAVFAPIRQGLEFLASQRFDSSLDLGEVPPDVAQIFRGKTGKLLIRAIPREDVWDRDAAERFVRDLRSVDPKATGVPVQNFEYLESLRASFLQAGQLALLVITVCVLAHFRNLVLTLLTLLPLGMAIIWTVGAMPVLGIQFSPANIITLPLVIGIGVAYGIYAIDRFQEDPSRSIFATSTAKATLLSALTTLFGFASLIIATYVGISSLGKLMTLAVSMCILTSLFVLPAVLSWLWPAQKTAE